MIKIEIPNRLKIEILKIVFLMFIKLFSWKYELGIFANKNY